MSVDDEFAGRRADEDDADVNADGSVGVGTDGSLVSDIDRGEGGVGVGTDGSLVSETGEGNDERVDDDREGRDAVR